MSGARPLRRFLAAALTTLAAAFAAAAAEPAAERETLWWLVQDLPPHFSYVGGKPPQQAADLANGELDGFLRLLIPRMPQYQHRFVEASFPRFEVLVRQGETICSLLHVKTPERLEWLYFTHLHTPLFSRQLHVIVHRDHLARFTSDRGQPLQLTALLKRRDLTGLLQRDRSYGPRIDALLAQADAPPAKIVAGRSMHMLTMLRAKRMDYTLEYPTVVDEYQRGGAPELVKLPIAEGRSTNVATAGCSRSPEGRRAIEALDGAVRSLAQDPKREAWVRQWRGEHLDEADRQRLHRYMDERARGGAQIE